MSKLAARKKRVKRNVEIGILAPEAVECVDPLDGRIAAIQLLIPLGLQAVTEELQQAVIDLARQTGLAIGGDASLLDGIRTKKDLTADLEAELKDILAAFVKTFA